MTEAVLDAGPVIHLDELNALDVLNDLILLVPETVCSEIIAHRPHAMEWRVPDYSPRRARSSRRKRSFLFAQPLGIQRNPKPQITAQHDDQRNVRIGAGRFLETSHRVPAFSSTAAATVRRESSCARAPARTSDIRRSDLPDQNPSLQRLQKCPSSPLTSTGW